MGKFVNEIGKKYGSLIVVSRGENGKGGDARFNCVCDCGNESLVQGKRKYLGSFKTQEEAHLVYLKEKLLEFNRIITELSEVLTETTIKALWKTYRDFENFTKSRMNSKGVR